MIKIEFEKQHTNGSTFRDAIVLTEQEIQKLTSDDIEALKLARFNNWIEQINVTDTING